MARESKRTRDERRFGKPERLADLMPLVGWHPPMLGMKRHVDVMESWTGIVKWFVKEVATANVIVADNVADYVLGHLPDKTLDIKSLPAIAFPFQKFFVECSRPMDPKIQPRFCPYWIDGSSESLPEQWGHLIFADKPSAMIETFAGLQEMVGSEAQRATRAAIIFSVVRRGSLCVGPLSQSFVMTDHAGAIVGTPVGQMLWGEYAEATSWKDYVPYVTMLEYIAMTALAFLSCKNVVIRQHDADLRQNRERRRAGLRPFVRYHTINIEPMKTVLRTEGQIETQGLKKALHICRGHFATYTADNPMFGHFVGTVWRPHHVRGSAKHGVVVTDYNVNPPNTGMNGATPNTGDTGGQNS